MDLAATSLSLIATERHLKSLLSILYTSSDPIQRNSVVYAISFLSNYQGNHEGFVFAVDRWRVRRRK